MLEAKYIWQIFLTHLINSKKFLSIIVLSLIFIISNCSEENNPVGNNFTNNIIPLTVGNSWNYRSILYDTSGNIIFVSEITRIINGDTLIGNTTWSYFVKDANYFANLSDGHYIYDQYSSDSNKISLVYKYPCKKNDTYSFWEVSNCDTQITVPAGTFNCILFKCRMQTGDSFSYYDVYIKPGIGIVKSVDYGYIPNHPIFEWIVRELTGYNLK